MDAEAVGFTTRQICDLAGVAPSTLNAWAARTPPLVSPSLLASAGKRADRFWSVRDLVVVRSIKVLRQAGCPMQQLSKAAAQIDAAWGTDLAGVVLMWDGSDLIATSPWGELQSLIQHPGQAMFHLVAMPLDQWRHAAESSARPIDLEAIRERRVQRAGARRQREAANTLRTSSAAMTLK